MILQNIFTYNYSIIGLVISLVVAFAIYHDAQDQGIEPVGYVILTCLCGFCIGGIVYLIVRSNHQNVVQRNPYYNPQPPSSSYQEPRYQPPSDSQQTYRDPSNPHENRPESSFAGEQTYVDNSSKPNGKFCSACGFQNFEQAIFCVSCGNKL